ncbi:MAG: hypothetical protein ABFC67_14635 [Mizugakiibacter sp.]|uniref:hypothetical protein n=1 Tax=Mizugakiibacter sp. TaxID=1972610 RepID=UPI00320FBF87
MKWIRANRVSLILFAMLLIGAASAWSLWPREKPAVGVSAPLPPAKEAKGEAKVPLQIRTVYVYRDRVKRKLDLPAPVMADPNKQVITTGKLDAEERPYTMTAVLDTQTGESQIYARPDPLPWLAPGKRGAVGIAYGVSDKGPDARLYGYRDLLQVKALHAGARGDLDQHGRWFAGGYVEWRF